MEIFFFAALVILESKPIIVVMCIQVFSAFRYSYELLAAHAPWTMDLFLDILYGAKILFFIDMLLTFRCAPVSPNHQ